MKVENINFSGITSSSNLAIQCIVTLLFLVKHTLFQFTMDDLYDEYVISLYPYSKKNNSCDHTNPSLGLVITSAMRNRMKSTMKMSNLKPSSSMKLLMMKRRKRR
jgi:hypothetical protein